MAINYTDKMRELESKSIDDQAKFFLRAFVLEFQGNFEKVLELAEEFKKYDGRGVGKLEEFEALRLLEARKETITFSKFRETFTEIELDKNRSLSFSEWALFYYKKSPKELFAPVTGCPPEILAALEKAIEAFQAVVAKKKAREEKMKKLEEIAKQGGVKGAAAKNELEQMRSEDETAANKELLTSQAKQKKMQKAVDSGDAAEKARQEAIKQEERRLKAEQEKKRQEEEKKKQESRQRLKDRSKAFNQ
eukprot:TRINITY_DN5395_c0_g1_i1.p1 TRINITY_DN5395_c0_g1~~TRINITY_DN5395_c0_g1_i1.p1  ORF type:complete len:249 (-),score=88.01 TRINITY_DN5395_c0_g1_i1:69-815(-)